MKLVFFAGLTNPVHGCTSSFLNPTTNTTQQQIPLPKVKVPTKRHTMSNAKKANNIRVMCRFRPMNDIEHSKNGSIIYKLMKKNSAVIEHPDKIHHPQPMSYAFDRIYGDKSAQVEIYQEAALPLIDNIFEGYNATIFAYGQTGTSIHHPCTLSVLYMFSNCFHHYRQR